MNKIDARQFVADEICSRWAVWKATPKLMDDFAEVVQKVSKEYAFNAVKKLRADNNFNTPDIGKLEKYCIEQTKKRSTGIPIPVTAVFHGSGYRVTIWIRVYSNENIEHAANRDCGEVLSKNEFKKWGDNYILFIGEENQREAIRKSMEFKGVTFTQNTVKNMAAVVTKQKTLDEIPDIDRRELLAQQAEQLRQLEQVESISEQSQAIINRQREIIENITDENAPF